MNHNVSEPIKEEGCLAVTFERKYYQRGQIFTKRSLRPRGYRTGYRELHIPRVGKERLMNEAMSLRYIREMTNIPVPTVYCDFEDDQAYYLMIEYVDGVGMSELRDWQKTTVLEELHQLLTTLKNLRSKHIGGPSGIVVPPYRVTRSTENDDWALQSSEQTNISSATMIFHSRTLLLTQKRWRSRQSSIGNIPAFIRTSLKLLSIPGLVLQLQYKGRLMTHLGCSISSFHAIILQAYDWLFHGFVYS